MAAIGLVTGIVGSNSADRIEAALVADGHTVTQLDHDTFASGIDPYTPYAAIVLVLVSRNSTKAAKIREVIQSGRGVVNCCDSPPDGTQTPLLNFVGLHAGSSFIWAVGNGKDVVVTDDSHDITAGYTEGVQTAVLAANDRRTQGLTGAVEGTVLATADPDNASLSGKAAIVQYPIGTVYLTTPFDGTAARVAFLGWVPDFTTLTADGTLLIQRATNWVLGGSTTRNISFAGTVPLQVLAAVVDFHVMTIQFEGTIPLQSLDVVLDTDAPDRPFRVRAFGSPCDSLIAIYWTPYGIHPGDYYGSSSPYRVDIYVEDINNPGYWVLIANDVPAALGMFGWAPDTPGIYRFRAELFLDDVLVVSGGDDAIAYSDSVNSGRSRVLTEEMRTLLGARQRQDRIWLFVEDADGEQRDRSIFLTGCEISYSIDARVGEASVHIRREHGSSSLAPELDASPLNRKGDGSYGPAIAVGRHFTIWVCPTAWNVTPAFADAIMIFCGRIDAHDFASSDASFNGRDIGGILADTRIEEVREYGAPEPGVPLADVIEQLLADNVPLTGLYVPADIDVELGLFNQEKELLLEAMRALALLGGADLRHLWQDNGSFPLTLEQPARELSEPDYVFAANEWLEVTGLGVSLVNIRNKTSGWYTSDAGQKWYVGTGVHPDDTSGLVNLDPTALMLTDPVSIEKYGPRYAELGLGSDSPVRTLATYQALQLAFILALSEPPSDLTIRTVMFWPAGLNRVYGFAADGLRFGVQRNFACVGYRHAYAKAGYQGNMEDIFESSLTVRAQTSPATEEYLQRENKPLTPGSPVPPGVTPPLPPDPTAMRITAASVTNTNLFIPWAPPALVTVSFTITNPDPAYTVSIDRSVDNDYWGEIVTLLALDAGTYGDTIETYENRPLGESPNVPHSSVVYRIRVVDSGNVTLLLRTTAALQIGPPTG